MFKFFKRKAVTSATPVFIDIHSHLLPALDDGVESFEESIKIIKEFEHMGYKKLITTPHIMHDFYNNTAETIKSRHKELLEHLSAHNMNIEVEVAAEYYLDDQLLEQVGDDTFEVLTFGNSYLLFETSFMNQPFYLNEFIFKAKSRGLNPVLAHPERYAYLQNNPQLIDDLIIRGVKLQLNINSLSGYYSKPVQKLAQKLVDKGHIEFIGSDCHNKNHIRVLKNTREEKYYRKALSLPLLNNTL